MIIFAKKAKTQLASDESQQNRFEQIRRTAKERHQKSDAEEMRRRARQTAEDNQPN